MTSTAENPTPHRGPAAIAGVICRREAQGGTHLRPAPDGRHGAEGPGQGGRRPDTRGTARPGGGWRSDPKTDPRRSQRCRPRLGEAGGKRGGKSGGKHDQDHSCPIVQTARSPRGTWEQHAARGGTRAGTAPADGSRAGRGGAALGRDQGMSPVRPPAARGAGDDGGGVVEVPNQVRTNIPSRPAATWAVRLLPGAPARVRDASRSQG